MGAPRILFFVWAFAWLLHASLGLDIYTSPESSPCVRLLSSQGVVGCHSTKVSGPIYLADVQSELDDFVSSSVLDQKYVVLLPRTLFTRQNIDSLVQSKKMLGIAITPSKPNQFSTASTCPNCEYGLYRTEENQHQWNPLGSGLAEGSFDFPIFALTDKDFGQVTTAVEYNRAKGFTQYPLYGMELDAYMWAIENSETCLRRRMCDPVGGRSVWSVFDSLSDSPDKKLVVVSSTLDSNSFFHELAAGRSAYVSGLVASLAAAEALSKLNPRSFAKNIAFTFFDAEAWGMSGSRRFVKEITQFECDEPVGLGCKQPYQQNLEFKKIKLENIDAFIELGQVSGLEASDGGVLYAHVDSVTASQSLVETLVMVANHTVDPAVYGSPFLQPAFEGPTNLRLPPSSAMAFLEKNRLIPTVVLGDFKTQFSNKYFYSSFDDVDNQNQNRTMVICQAAEVAAKTAYLLANPGSTINDTSSLVVDCDLVDNLMHCLIQNVSCPLVTQYLDTLGQSTISHYTGVFFFGKIPLISAFVHSFLTEIMATEEGGECPCDTSEKPFTCVKNKCVLAPTQYHDAYPTGLEWDYKKQKFAVVDSTEPTWTESQWRFTLLRMFLLEGTGSQVGTLVTGIVITCATAGLTLFLKSYLSRSLKED